MAGRLNVSGTGGLGDGGHIERGPQEERSDRCQARPATGVDSGYCDGQAAVEKRDALRGAQECSGIWNELRRNAPARSTQWSSSAVEVFDEVGRRFLGALRRCRMLVA